MLNIVEYMQLLCFVLPTPFCFVFFFAFSFGNLGRLQYCSTLCRIMGVLNFISDHQCFRFFVLKTNVNVIDNVRFSRCQTSKHTTSTNFQLVIKTVVLWRRNLRHLSAEVVRFLTLLRVRSVCMN